MKVLFASILLAATILSSTAQAWTLPLLDKHFFVGSTQELMRIRGGIAHLAGYPASSWTVPYSDYTVLLPPLGLGAIDCLDSGYELGQGPYDGAEDYLGMSTWVIENGVQIGVEIPALEDLKSDTYGTWPGECYGYFFALWCVASGIGDFICPDPVP